MSTCYRPPPQQTRAVVTSLALDAHNGDDDLLDMQRSIYIFPNPSSAPPSPGGSMVSSIPSDYSGTVSGSSRSGSREHSLSLSTSRSSRSPRGRVITGSDTDAPSSPWHVVRPTGGHIESTSNNGTDREIGVEVLDWSPGPDEGSDGNNSWDLQAEVERISRWGISLHSDETWPHASSSTSRPLVMRTYRSHPLHRNQDFSGHFQFHNTSPERRSRTHVSSSTGGGPSTNLASTFSSSFGLSAVQCPHPRMHIALLSFVASLFALDLDDPALRLLTSSTSTSESVLFSGHSALLLYDTTNNVDDEDSDSSETFYDDVDVEEGSTQTRPEPHGFLRLLVLSDESKSSMRALRDGLAVISSSCSPNTILPVSPFSLPSLGGVFGLCRLVGDACLKGGKAWRELRS